MDSSSHTNPTNFGFPVGSLIFSLEADARWSIIQARLRINPPSEFVRFWDRVLTDEDRAILGDDVDVCFKKDNFSANHLAQIRTWQPEHAIAEIAYRLGHISLVDYEWLLSMIAPAAKQGSPQLERTNSDKLAIPSWDRVSGKLEFRRQLCRALTVARAKSIVPVLDAFEESGWPNLIEELVDCSEDPQRVHQVVRNLNAGLKHISFSVQNESICWNPTAS